MKILALILVPNLSSLSRAPVGFVEWFPIALLSFDPLLLALVPLLTGLTLVQDDVHKLPVQAGDHADLQASEIRSGKQGREEKASFACVELLRTQHLLTFVHFTLRSFSITTNAKKKKDI